MKIGDLIVRKWISKSQKKRVCHSLSGAKINPEGLCIVIAVKESDEMMKIMYMPSFEYSVLPLDERFFEVVNEGR